MKIEVTLTIVENEAVEYTITTGADSWADIHTIIDNELIYHKDGYGYINVTNAFK